METVGFLMMAHMIEPAALLEQARIMEAAGADCVYVVDSAGAMTDADARARVAGPQGRAQRRDQVGIHAHNNLSLARRQLPRARSRSGVDQVDGCSRGLGAGAGNCPTEVLIAVSDKLGWQTGIDALRDHGRGRGRRRARACRASRSSTARR